MNGLPWRAPKVGHLIGPSGATMKAGEVVGDGLVIVFGMNHHTDIV